MLAWPMESPRFSSSRGVADEVKPGVVVRHLEVEPIGLKRLSLVEGIDQRLDTE